MTEYSIAITMVVIAAALVGLFLWFKSHTSERRMLQMLERRGLDPGIAKEWNYADTMEPARRRCRNCQSEDVCERWLKGELTGDNDFCPNAQVFEGLRNGPQPLFKAKGFSKFYY